MKQLSQAMAEAAFLQYASHANKIEIQELIAFSKVRAVVLTVLLHFHSYVLIPLLCVLVQSDTSTAALTTIITASLEC